MANTSLIHVSDRELLERTKRAAADERAATVELIELLGEVDSRRLYLPEGFSSLFSYCTQVLRFSENEAYHRIAAARAARSFPEILDRLREGTLTLTSITLLRPHMTPANAGSLIADATGKSKREVERQMAVIAPKPDVKTMVRRLPEPKTASGAGRETLGPAREQADRFAPAPEQPPPPGPPRSMSAPLSSDRFLLRVTLNSDAHAKLVRAQDLLRHSVPNGDPAAVIDRALTVLVEDLERRRIANVKRPRQAPQRSSAAEMSSRYVPASVRREVWRRDAGRCAFVGVHGRCTETGRLEIHHLEPFARGGASTVANLELRCRAHNQYESTLLFGEEWRERTNRPTGPGPS